MRLKKQRETVRPEKVEQHKVDNDQNLPQDSASMPDSSDQNLTDDFTGIAPATKNDSGFRKKRYTSEYSEGPRATERPLEGDKSIGEIAEGVFATQRRLETLMDPAIARSRLRALGLDDDLGEHYFLDSSIFRVVIAEKMRCRGAVYAALDRNFRYINEWWNSQNPVERLWGQLNNAFVIVPRWQFVEDLNAVLRDQMEEKMPAGFVDEYLIVIPENKELLKQKVYAVLLKEGFPDGEDNKIYTAEELDAIIATKPLSVKVDE